MAFDTFADLLNHDTIVAADDIEIKEENKEKQIVTPLFTMTFHNMDVQGFLIDGGNSMFLGDVFNLCDRVVIRIATAIVHAQELIFGLEATASGKAGNIIECFDEKLQLLPEYAKHMDDTKMKRASTYAAEIHAYMKTLYALIDARAKLMPMVKQEIQFAWNSEKHLKITNLKEAIAYRIATGNTMKDVKKRLATQKNHPGQEAKDFSFVTLKDLLG